MCNCNLPRPEINYILRYENSSSFSVFPLSFLYIILCKLRFITLNVSGCINFATFFYVKVKLSLC
jgi:hypothetical protein